MARQYSVAVGEAANVHETAPRRSAAAAAAPATRPRNMHCSTVYEFLVECCGRSKTDRAMGWRDVKEIHEESKQVVKDNETVEKTWLYYELSHYKYTTFNELLEQVQDLGRGLVAAGLDPAEGHKLHIYASTSHKWLKMFLAAQSQALPVVTAYDTLGISGLIHSLVQTGSRAIFTDNSLLENLIDPIMSCPDLQVIIYSESIDPKDKRQKGKLYKTANDALNTLKSKRPELKFYTFHEILKLGIQNRDKIALNLPKPNDMSCIMYTSGSTGDPKGVVLTHSNVVAAIGGTSQNVEGYITRSDRVIAFLPLAHIFELVFELLSLCWGSCLGYATVKTLTNNSVRNCQSDLQEFKPTVMVGVAAVWETVRKGILLQINHLPSLTQKIFWSAYYTKLKLKQYHLPGGDLLGNLVFKKIKQATGGELRYLLNGGSPISTDAQIFISNLVAPMLIGYGLTETTANGCILYPNHFEYGVTGDLVGSITVKLIDVEDLGYLAKNNQGEILIKGDCVTSEYYKNPEETKRSFTEDGWFCTGDIGEWTPNGHLKIIDRKKNLVKTLNGEYIALEKLESIYRSNQYVQNICVYADQTKVKPVAIIVPNLPPLTALAKKLGILKKDEDSIEDHLHDPTLVKTVLQDLLAMGKKQGLNGIELLQGIVFFEEEWTPQNGFVTSAQKLKRKKILDVVKDDVNKIYGA